MNRTHPLRQIQIRRQQPPTPPQLPVTESTSGPGDEIIIITITFHRKTGALHCNHHVSPQGPGIKAPGWDELMKMILNAAMGVFSGATRGASASPVKIQPSPPPQPEPDGDYPPDPGYDESGHESGGVEEQKTAPAQDPYHPLDYRDQKPKTLRGPSPVDVITSESEKEGEKEQ